VLSEQPQGVEPPQGIMIGLEARGASLPDGRITAQMLEGQFRFKPRGSVETADPRALRADFNQMLQALPALIAASPFLQQALLMNPQAARALLEQFVRVYRIPNRQGRPRTSHASEGRSGRVHLPARAARRHCDRRGRQ
jgi:hypothetical protein